MATMSVQPTNKGTILNEKNVLVTGGASGLGLAFANELCSRGARVAVADLNEDAGRTAAEDLLAQGFRAKFFRVDVSSAASQIDMLKQVLGWLDGETLDSIIMSAGINGNPFDLKAEDPATLGEDFARNLERTASTLQVNLTGAMMTAQLCVKYGMGLDTDSTQQNPTIPDSHPRRPFKSVTFIGSLAGYRALPRATDYSASKFGVRGAFRSLRQQLPALGVRCNLIAPAFVKTPLLDANIKLFESMHVRFAPIENVVQAVMRAVTDTSCTGRSFAVTAEGVADLDDDAEGMDGASQMAGLVQRGALSTNPSGGKIILGLDT